ncbi:hypothetical protein AcV5_003864 [Taiwanofungus camphoratus]|nr:hypothetical protein AcV5_003864 [Antrodia cinnamomea]
MREVHISGCIRSFCLDSSNYLAPLIAGFIWNGQGWPWVMYWAAIINAVALVLLFFFMEETNYLRDISQADSDDVTNEKIKYLDVSSDAKIELVGTPTSFRRRLAVFNKRYASNATLVMMAYRPVLLLRFPVVFWAGFQYGACLVWYNVLNATASLILSAPPYNFRASSVGLTYIAPMIGMTIGCLYSGWAGDRFALRCARRTGGVREPEHRLWLMLLACVLCPSSLILWGVGAAKGVPWIGLVVGMGMISCSTGIGSALSLGYALDAYRDMSGEVMIAVILVRNTLSFAIGYGITPWLHMGYQNTFISAAFVGLAITTTFLAVVRWGKAWRARSRKAYWAIRISNVALVFESALQMPSIVLMDRLKRRPSRHRQGIRSGGSLRIAAALLRLLRSYAQDIEQLSLVAHAPTFSARLVCREELERSRAQVTSLDTGQSRATFICPPATVAGAVNVNYGEDQYPAGTLLGPSVTAW